MSIEAETSPLADKKYRMRFNKALREKGVPAKACGACFVVKGHGEFSVKRDTPDGRNTHCRACKADAHGIYRRENRERVAERVRRWRTENRERAAEYGRRWYKENREPAAERVRRWREENPDRKAEYKRRYRARKAAATVTPFTPADLRADWEEHDLYGCFYCGGPAEPLHVDHFYPLNPADEDAAPGPHAVDNLVPACESCNTSKGNRDPWAFLSDALAARGVDLDACLAVFDVE